MAQASVLTDADIRRVFRIIETTRHADRNRLAFVLSIYGGMRVGEIAALIIEDVVNQYEEARREIKLASDQTKGERSRTVVLSNRVKKEIESYLKVYRHAHPDLQFDRNVAGRFPASRSLCCSGKCTIWPAFGLRRIMVGEHLRLGSMLKVWGCERFRSSWVTGTSRRQHCIARCRRKS